MVAFATQVKRRRGTTAQNDAFTGAEGEIVVDTQKHTLRVHDGETQGGFEMAKQAELNDKADVSYVDSQLLLKANQDLSNVPDNYDYVVESQLPTADNSYMWYRKYKSGWVEQGGSITLPAIGTSFYTTNITLLIEMASSRYNVCDNGGQIYSGANGASQQIAPVSSTTIQIAKYNMAQSLVTWQVCGMAAQ